MMGSLFYQELDRHKAKKFLKYVVMTSLKQKKIQTQRNKDNLKLESLESKMLGFEQRNVELNRRMIELSKRMHEVQELNYRSKKIIMDQEKKIRLEEQTYKTKKEEKSEELLDIVNKEEEISEQIDELSTKLDEKKERIKELEEKINKRAIEEVIRNEIPAREEDVPVKKNPDRIKELEKKIRLKLEGEKTVELRKKLAAAELIYMKVKDTKGTSKKDLEKVSRKITKIKEKIENLEEY